VQIAGSLLVVAAVVVVRIAEDFRGQKAADFSTD